MLRSMTGFGAANGRVDDVEFNAEVRSVNNRYLKCGIKLPDALSAWESEIDKALRQQISRGTVTLSVRMKVPKEMAAYKVNSAALQSYLDQLKPAELDANPTMRINLGSILQLPGVCEPPPVAELVASTKDGFLALVEVAIAELVKMREVEGKAIKADLLGHCRSIGELLAGISKRAPLVVEDYHRRLSERVAELTKAAKVNIDEEHLAREVAIFAERCDIAEEISRLTGHLEQFEEAMASPEPAGRKLDFIAQEMLREANTIASKANDADIARAVVDIKTAIDRIKEQAANAE